MHSVALLVILGASLARGVSLEERTLESEDTSGKILNGWSDIAERHDEEFPAAQYPMVHTDSAPVLDQAIDSVGYSLVQAGSLSQEDDQANPHAILKRDPGFVTFVQTVFQPVTVIQSVAVPISVPYRVGPFRIGSEATTLTESQSGTLTVISSEVLISRVTEIVTKTGAVYEVTVPPPSATEEFLTSTYAVETAAETVVRQVGVPVSVFYPALVTVRPVTVTVTETETYFLTARQTTFVPVTTRTIVEPNECPSVVTSPETITKIYVYRPASPTSRTAVDANGCPVRTCFDTVTKIYVYRPASPTGIDDYGETNIIPG